MKKVISLVLSFLVLACLFPIPCLALGVAMGPANMEIQDALRGSEYKRTVTVFNPSDAQTQYSLRADGQAAGWLSFHDFDTQNAIQSLTIAGKSNTVVLIKINVPPDVPNGTYTATVYAETAPSGSIGDTGVSSILQAKSVLNVTVAGTQIISGTVLNIESGDTEAGFPLILLVRFSNTGNIGVKPQIDCTISKDSQTVDQFSHNQTEVRAENQDIIPVEWDTSSKEVGSYTAKVNVLLNGESLMTKEIPFDLLPPGTLSKQGEIISLKYSGQPTLGSMLKILAGFKNTGEGTAQTRLIAEVFYNGNLVDTLQSEETLVPAGQTGELLAYFKPVQTGNYTVKGYISYEGKKTEFKEIALEIASTRTADASPLSGQSNPVDQQNNTNTLYYILGGVILVIFIALVFFKFRNKTAKS